MTPIEIMALIILVVATIKILIILVNPKTWVGVIDRVWASPALMMIVSLILAAISLYYLLQEGITIVQIFAVMLFMSFLIAIGVSVYVKEILSMSKKLLKDRSIIKRSWLYLLIWIVLIVWGFKELLM
jgi:hypothetical protein